MDYDNPPAPGDDDAPPQLADVTRLTPRNQTTATTHANINVNVGRVPPHNWDTEAALLAAMMTKAACIDTAVGAGLTRADFHKPDHAELFDVCVDLRANNPDSTCPADPNTVRARLVAANYTVADLVDFAQGAVTGNAAQYAELIAADAHRRRLLDWLSKAADAAYNREPFTVEPPTRPTTGTKEPLVTDMQAVMNGESDPIIPNIAPRDDNLVCFLYGPGINWLSGEPGKGKSMLARWLASRELRNGNKVLVIDYEGTSQGMAAYMKEMGVTDVTNLHYVRRSDQWDVASLAEYRQLVKDNQYTLVVIDAVAGAMECEGLDPESNRDVEKWVALTPMIAFDAGAAVLCIDHVTKNKETRGRWMIGAQRKMARADAAYMLEMSRDAGIGTTGYGRLVVAKDRYGALSAFTQGRTIAEVAIISEACEGGHELSVMLSPPQTPDNTTPSGPTWYMEQVSRCVEEHGPIGKVDIRTRIGRRTELVDKAIMALADGGFIVVDDAAKGRAKPYVSAVPYRQPLKELAADVPSRYESVRDIEQAELDDGEPF